MRTSLARGRVPGRRALAAAVLTATLAAVVVPPVPAGAAPVGYTVVSATEKVLSTATVSGTATARLTGAGNEFVSFQVVIAGGQSGVSVSAGAPLTGPSGTIANTNVTIYREDYLTTTRPSAAGRAVGAWPDILIPTVDRLYGQSRRAFPVDVPAGQNRVAFVDVLIPRGQPAGWYDGSLVLTSSTGTATVPIHLVVRDFDLPSTSSLRSMYGMLWSGPCDALYGTCDAWASEANLQRAWRTNADFARLALDNRMTIGNPQFQPPANAGEIAHVNQYMLPLLNGTAATRLPGARLTSVEVDTGHLAAWRSLAQSNGFTGRAVSYDRPNCDEIGGNATRWATCRTRVAGYKSAWPGLPNLVTATINDVDTHDPTHAATDIITPVVDHMDDTTGPYAGDQHARYASFLAEPGKQVWLYTSCDVSGCAAAGETDPKVAAHRWVDYTVDTLAAQNRAMGWLAYTYNASGELYYATTQRLTTAWTDQWAFGGNGDGTLFYPGTTARIGGTTPIPLESLRMKMIRNGYQDHEYLRLATAAGHGAQALSIARNLYPSMHDAAPTAAAIDLARGKLADLIDPPLRHTARRVTGPVVVDGQLGEFAGQPAITFAGSGNTTNARVVWDDQRLYVGYTVADTVIAVNQTGRDGELWNGDGVEVMIDRNATRPTHPNRSDYHLLVNTDGALTDEQGDGTGWDRSWTAGAATAVARVPGGYAVEIAVPWTAIGGRPSVGTTVGFDVAANDTDTPGTVRPHDWANLTRFAQPQAWGSLTLG
ncbi:sugar-binding protein [Micromonospora sp. BQ11]|uniref:sugar-binding protein n=1 Tax=Micromonospora sp. BQ11 TaxID=3452212 RepID=UPI003F89F242